MSADLDPPVAPSSIGPAPEGPEEFDQWARAGFDAWQRSAVVEEAGRRWADPDRSAADRLLAGIWGAAAASPPAAALEPLLTEVDDEVLRARALAVLALDKVATDTAAAISLVDQAEQALGSDVDVRTRLAVWFAASEVHARAGDIAGAVEVLDRAGAAAVAEPEAPAWAPVAIDAERVALLAPRIGDRNQVAGAADKVAAAAAALPPSPTSIEVLIKICGMLAALGAAGLAERYAEQVLSITESIPEAIGARFQAHLVLADALLGVEGPAAAMEPQQAAVDLMEPLGPSPMLGWARKGMAGFLRALDRHDDAAAQFALAAEAYRGAGITGEAAAMVLEQAEDLLYADRVEEAAALVDEVVTSVDSMPEPLRAGVMLQAHRVQAHLAATEGNLDAAAEHWLEVADLAPSLGLSDLEARLTAAQLYVVEGDDAEADAQFLRAELTAAESPDPARATAMVMRVRAEALRDSGRAEDAAEVARLAANHARTSGDEAQAIYLSVVAADSLHQAGDSAAAVQIYEESLEAAQAAGFNDLKGAVHAGFAQVLRDLGRSEEATGHEAEARRLNPGAPPPT